MKTNKIYIVWDKVTETENCVIMAKNEKEAVRSLVFSGYFKVNRLKDTDLICTEAEILTDDKKLKTKSEDAYKSVNIEEVLKELSIEMENKAEEKPKEEIAKKIEETRKGAEK